MKKIFAAFALVCLLATGSFAQGLAPYARLQFFTSAGAVCNACTLTTSLTGTSTPSSVYSDSSLMTAFQNPMTLNSAGRPTVNGSTEAGIFLDTTITYRFVLKSSAGVTIWTQDGVTAPVSASFSGTVGFIPNFTGTGTTIGNSTCISESSTTVTIGASCVEIVPTLVGGASVTSGLDLKSTTANGTTDRVRLLTGNNGATVSLVCTTSGCIASPNFSDAGLTSGRVTVAGASGLLGDFANFTYASPELSIGAAGVTGALNLLGSTSGTAKLTAAATAGTPTLTLPTASGALMGYADSRYEIITATRDMTAATNSVAYTGCGFRPTAITTFSNQSTNSGWSVGFSENNGSLEQSNIYSSSGSVYTNAAALINKTETFDTAKQVFVITSYDADGFTGTWTKTGTPTGTVDVFFRCER